MQRYVKREGDIRFDVEVMRIMDGAPAREPSPLRDLRIVATKLLEANGSRPFTALRTTCRSIICRILAVGEPVVPVHPSVIKWLNLRGAEVLRHLSKHVLGLSWVHALREPRCDTGNANRDYDVRTDTATAFLLAANSYCFLITAGHRITRLNETTEGSRRLVKAFFHIGLHLDNGGEALRFPLEELPRLPVDDEVLGLDYGAILLNKEAFEIATKKGNSPIPQGNWEEDLERVDLHAMLGFPRERRERTRRMEGTTTIESLRFGTPLLPLEEIKDPESYSMDAPCERFCAKIVSREGHFEDESIFLIDISGMSGGPVFALEAHPDSCDYQLIGVQSEWDERSGVIAACFVRPFVEALLRKID